MCFGQMCVRSGQIFNVHTMIGKMAVVFFHFRLRKDIEAEFMYYWREKGQKEEKKTTQEQIIRVPHEHHHDE